MRKDQIVVGGSYINEAAAILREVVEELDSQHIRVNAFELHTGKLIPTRHSVWHRSRLARWADREARPAEQRAVHPYQAAPSSVAFQPPEHTGAPLERARNHIDASPGHHTFPRGK